MRVPNRDRRASEFHAFLGAVGGVSEPGHGMRGESRPSRAVIVERLDAASSKHGIAHEHGHKWDNPIIEIAGAVPHVRFSFGAREDPLPSRVGQGHRQYP